jgi:hypothetical protein
VAATKCVKEITIEKIAGGKEKKEVRPESLTLKRKLYLSVLNSRPLICLYCGLVAPKTDFT